MVSVTIHPDADGIPQVHIDVDLYGREVLMKAHSTLMHDIRQAHQWFDDPDVPAEQKANTWLTLFNMQTHQLFLYRLLKATGYTDIQISEDLDVPF